MPKLVPIVEGEGETTAAPVLFHKLLGMLQRPDLQVAIPKNAKGRSNLLKAGGLEKFVEMAWRERDCGAVVILLDAEDDCPVEVAKDFSERIELMGVRFTVVIACAVRMYETWFLASLETIKDKDLAGRPGIIAAALPTAEVESIKNPKSWLNDHFPPGRVYRETEDQEVMTRLLDTALAKERSRSFRRLCQALEQAVAAIDNGVRIITPSFPDQPATAGKRGKRRKR